MAGELQPLDQKFAIVDRFGRPNEYFTRWAQQRQIDIGTSITLGDLEAFLTAHKLAAGHGIILTPDGDINNQPNISIANGTGLNFDVMGNLKIADTAVTPGTYGDATHVPAIVVDQQGRITGVTLIAISGGGGAAWDFSPPLAAGFSKVSGDATNLTLADDANVGLLIDHGAATGSYVERIGYKTLSNKALDWTLVAKFKRTFGQTNYRSIGLRLHDSISNHLLLYDLRWDGAPEVAVDKYNDLIGTGGVVGFAVPLAGGSVFEWQRVRHTGGNYLFDWSPDGKQWANIFTIGDTAHTTNRADRVGFGSLFWNTGPALQYSIPYWSLTGPGV